MPDVYVEYLTNYKKKEWGPLTYAKPGDACFDLRAAIKNSQVLMKDQVAVISTGVKFAIPEGYEIQIRPRSGFASKNSVIIVNSPGTIDSGYRGEVKVALLSCSRSGVVIQPGARIAQAKLAEVLQLNFIETNDVATSFESERGEGGFGSTGN